MSVILFDGDDLLTSNQSFFFNSDHFVDDQIFIGEYEGKKFFSAPATSQVGEKIRLRDLFTTSDPKTVQLISRAKHLLQWHQGSRFCGACGGATHWSSVEMAKICGGCEKVTYPSTSLVVMCLVEKDGQILLARSPHFEGEMYSVLAGFVDSGESCEAAVHREVQEEVGLKIKNIRYFGSQPWPFPGSTILGFFAEYDSGEIAIDGVEIEAAGWFDRQNLPSLPHPCSLSRHLIDRFLQGPLPCSPIDC